MAVRRTRVRQSIRTDGRTEGRPTRATRRLRPTRSRRRAPGRQQRATTRRGPGRTARAAEGAQRSLRQFRQASIVAVAVTGFLLLIVGVDDSTVAQAAQLPTNGAAQAAEEATGTIRGLLYAFLDNLPKYGIAAGVLIFAGLLVRLVRTVLRRVLRSWERSSAVTALSAVVIWLVAIGITTAILVGDIRALVGSLGLVGLALSWALQTPIESFTGWLLNSFHRYYRVGDRIAVGDVFGDVYRIDVLSTTVWEYGSSATVATNIQAEQPTGRLITFPNHEILSGSVVNYTRDFPYLWDELTVSVATESDLAYAMEVVLNAGKEIVGEYMKAPAQSYQALLRREGLETSVATEPTVFLAITDWGANISLRYLVEAREKRIWSTRLAQRVTMELNSPEHRTRIKPVYPRHQVQVIDPEGSPK